LLVAEGTASVTFVGKTLVGVGAVVAAVHAASRRLVLQEELSESLADIFFDVLSADSVEVEIALKHGCMRHRGERAEGTTVRTVATRTRATKGDP
jgi:GTP cyclohydrolase I